MVSKLSMFLGFILMTQAAHGQHKTFEEIDAIDKGDFYLREFRLEADGEALKDVTVSCKKQTLAYYFIADSASYGFQSRKISLELKRFNDNGSIGIDSRGQHWFVWFELNDEKKKKYMFGTNQIYMALDDDDAAYSDRIHYHVSDKNICDSSVLAELGPKARFLKH
jgi:hypothetical protein